MEYIVSSSLALDIAHSARRHVTEFDLRKRLVLRILMKLAQLKNLYRDERCGKETIYIHINRAHRIPEEIMCYDQSISTCSHASFLFSLFFYPEDGSDMFLRNVG
jgi:hypothetical protein